MKKYFLIAIIVISGIKFTYAQSQNADTLGYIFDTVAMVPTTPVKSQYKAGTCWSYATASFVETEVLRTTGKELDLSEIYFVYYAYQAKAESFVRLHGKANFGPGGQAHDVMDVIAKHGMITEDNFVGIIPGFDNHVHGEFDNILSSFVSSVTKNPSGHLSQAWQNAYVQLLNSYIGDATKAETKANALRDDTKFDTDDYIELTSYMYKDYYTQIRLEVPDNWSFSNYYNIPLNEMMDIMNNALKNGYSVCWDGDVSSKGFSHKNALAILPESNMKNIDGTEQSKWEDVSETEMKKNMYSFENPVPEKNVTDKMRQEAFDDYSITDDHLMHLTGLLKDQNGTLYYVTKNSWKDDSNDNGGYLNMSDAYVKLATVAIMVHKDAIPKSLRKKLKIK